jgi:hypothetical protein
MNNRTEAIPGITTVVITTLFIGSGKTPLGKSLAQFRGETVPQCFHTESAKTTGFQHDSAHRRYHGFAAGAKSFQRLSLTLISTTRSIELLAIAPVEV